MKQKDLLQQLQSDCTDILNFTKNVLVSEDSLLLHKKPNEKAWSVFEILEHLNLYFNYYNLEIEKLLNNPKAKLSTVDAEFVSGWLGNYFTKSMMPGENKVISNKMQAPKAFNPLTYKANENALIDFEHNLNTFIVLIQKSNVLSWSKNRIPISISKFITLKLGDVFRFNTAHILRHFTQVKNTLHTLKTMNGK